MLFSFFFSLINISLCLLMFFISIFCIFWKLKFALSVFFLLHLSLNILVDRFLLLLVLLLLLLLSSSSSSYTYTSSFHFLICVRELSEILFINIFIFLSFYLIYLLIQSISTIYHSLFLFVYL